MRPGVCASYDIARLWADSQHWQPSDGWSTALFERELATLYAAFAAGKPSPLPNLAFQYADFASWQRGWLRGEVLATELDVWRRRLAGASVLELHTDRPRPAVPSRRGAGWFLALSPDLSRQLQVLARRSEATLFMTLLAGFQALLSRYTGQEDVSVGTPVAGRNRVEIEPLIGFFVNTLVVRTDLGGEPGFGELLRRTFGGTRLAPGATDRPCRRVINGARMRRST